MKSFATRMALLVVAAGLVIGGLAFSALRSLSGKADEALEVATGSGNEEAASLVTFLSDSVSSNSTRMLMYVGIATLAFAALTWFLAKSFATSLAGKVNAAAEARFAAVASATSSPGDIIAEVPANEQDDMLLVDAESDSSLAPAAAAAGAGVVAGAFADNVFDEDREVSAVASTASTDSRSEAEIAADAAQTRKQHAQPFVNLSRRSQNLLARQMKFIDAMEKDETNPANLKRLFQIDHLATRMRRNAESIMVLADESSPRRLRKAVSMHQVVQAASGEIEHFDRISITGIADAHVDGATAHDLAHLLAELLDNATSFAPPETSVTVNGQPTEHGYLMEIVDHGIGMDESAMAATNARLADHTGELDNEFSSNLLGHHVVGRLARRHRIAVDLTPTATGGVTARVHVPHSTLADAPGKSAPGAASSAPPASAFSDPVDVPDDASSLMPEAEMPSSDGSLDVPTPSASEHGDSDVASSGLTLDIPVAEVPAAEVPDSPAVPSPDLDLDVPDPFTSSLDTSTPQTPEFEVPAAADLAEPAVLPGSDMGLPQRTPEIPEPTMEAIEPLAPAADPAPAPSPASAAPAPAPAAVPEAEPAGRSLSDKQRAAIEWAMEKRGGTVSASLLSPGPVSASQPETSGLRAGPLDANELDTTASGLLRRQRGEAGAKHFAETATSATSGIASPGSPEQLLAFRQGVNAGREKIEEEGTS